MRTGTLAAAAALVVVAVAAAAAAPARALSMLLPMNKRKCFRQEFADDVLAKGSYEVRSAEGMTIKALHVVVRDPDDAVVYDNGGLGNDGTFGFTTTFGGEYTFCLEDRWAQGVKKKQRKAARDLPPRHVTLTLHSGVDAIDYEALAKKEHMSELDVQLKRIEDQVNAIVKDFEHMRGREERHRSTNESTFSRVSWFSVASIMILFGLGAWQVYHMRVFFKRKKLL